VVEGVPHTLMKKCVMQPAMPQLRNRGRTAEQGNPIVQAERASSTRFAFEFSEEAKRVFLHSHNAAELRKKVEVFRIFLRPSACVYARPNLCFLRADDSHANLTRRVGCDLLDRTVKNVADLYGSVVA
jgi:hypothetical protein